MSTPLAILHVEDVESDSELVVRLLRKADFDLVYERVEEAAAMRTMLDKRAWDIIISDYNLPRFDGPAALKVLRESGQDIPFIVLSGTIGEDTAVDVMRTGVSDYLMKGNLSRLVPSIKRELVQASARRAGKAAAAALRKIEMRYRELFRSAKDALFVFPVSHDGIPQQFTDVNAVACAMLGYTTEELLKLSPLDITEPTHVETARTSIELVVAGGELNLFESLLLAKDGRQVPVEISSNIVSTDEELTFFAVLRDISERKVAERALLEAAERFQRIVSAANVGLWDWNLVTNEVEFSREYKRQIGYAEDELSAGLDDWTSRLHPDDKERAIAYAMRYVVAQDTSYSQEFRLLHRDGTYRWFLAQGAVMTNEAGKPSHMLGSHIDITDRKRLEEQFQQSQKMESVGRLAGGIAHDFNNLLCVINGYADMAMDSTECSKVREDLAQIQRAGNRAAELTQQLLAFSRKQVLRDQVLDLNQVLSDSEKMLRRVISEDIELHLVAGPQVGKIKADQGQIEQVVMNLMVNARDAMPNGGELTVETGCIHLNDTARRQYGVETAGDYVMLRVTDTGSGMDACTMRQVFEPFFTTKEVGKGTGLGLSTVYGIVHQSGGCVSVESEVGTGTTFTVLLPRVEEAQEELPCKPAEFTPPGSGVILLAEDDAALRSLTSLILTNAGYTVLAAECGIAALEIFAHETRPVRLLVTDVVMPGMSGPELAERLKSGGMKTKTLFLSGYAGEAVLRHGVIQDGISFLGKPFTRAALLQKVSLLLGASN